MNKISLNLDTLKVSSFATSEPEPALGTVNAHSIITEQVGCTAGCNTRNTCSTRYC